MSVNYAENLSPYDNKGKCGGPELFEPDEAIEEKAKILAQWIKESQHCVTHTGAGISTAAGIPDFRGPNGVWTLEKKGLNPVVNVRFEDAVPTFTHLALVALEKAGYVKYLVTQNVDGLHLRSGYPRDRLSELHGNVFVEQCPGCKVNHIRPTTVPTIGRKLTGGICGFKKRSGHVCRGKLRDTVLDWEDSLPTFDLTLAEHHSRLADLSICLGSTLQIVPAGNLPTYATKVGGKLAIVNLQATKQDSKADLIIHAKVDAVMRIVLQHLGLEVAEGKVAEMVLKSANGPPDMPPNLAPAIYSCQPAGSNRQWLTARSTEIVTRHKVQVTDEEPLKKLLKIENC